MSTLLLAVLYTAGLLLAVVTGVVLGALAASRHAVDAWLDQHGCGPCRQKHNDPAL